MSRIIPNRKQADENTIIGGKFNKTIDDLDVDLFPSRGLDFYNANVLFRSDDYIVIDKPPGVRMNGAFEGTTSECGHYCT